MVIDDIDIKILPVGLEVPFELEILIKDTEENEIVRINC